MASRLRVRYAAIDSVQFARPGDTTAYAAGDIVANSITAGSVVPLSWQIPGNMPYEIAGILLRKSTAGVTNAQFAMNLFSAAPGFAGGGGGGDNSVMATVLTGMANWLGVFSGTMLSAGSDGACVELKPVSVALTPYDPLSLTGQLLYGVLEARAAYAPGNAETFDARLILRTK